MPRPSTKALEGAAAEHGEAAAGGHEKAEGRRCSRTSSAHREDGGARGGRRGASLFRSGLLLHQFEIVIYSLFVAVLISIIAISVANNWQSVLGRCRRFVDVGQHA